MVDRQWSQVPSLSVLDALQSGFWNGLGRCQVVSMLEAHLFCRIPSSSFWKRCSSQWYSHLLRADCKPDYLSP